MRQSIPPLAPLVPLGTTQVRGDQERGLVGTDELCELEKRRNVDAPITDKGPGEQDDRSG